MKQKRSASHTLFSETLFSNDVKEDSPVVNRNDLFDEVQWQPQVRKAAPYINQRGSWLVFTDSHGLGEALVSHLEAQGENCIQIFPGQSYQALKGEACYWLNPAQLQDFSCLFRELQASNHPPCRGVLYLWTLDAVAPDEISTNILESVATTGLKTLIHLIMGLHRSGWSELPRLWVVTRGTQQIGPANGAPPADEVPPADEAPPVDEVPVAHSVLWEMAREVAVQEHKTLWSGMIDLDPTAPAGEAALLFEEIWQPNGDDQIAFRQGQRYLPQVTSY